MRIFLMGQQGKTQLTQFINRFFNETLSGRKCSDKRMMDQPLGSEFMAFPTHYPNFDRFSGSVVFIVKPVAKTASFPLVVRL